ncbi:MAG: hydroxymethylbilane synthase [Pirellulales bacterium]|jgi:hydroxymethylbilane synthase|nr:hydroxymethylbilane synthase [Thermoguttaceae bacterium]MDD4787574.1 hydroxymethylbilane synthase [Pirellulales bacterium]MDI9444812.1 hydroxymethylbilane synthase [Planctomycetota bacterium]NLZ00662.1 hydroxymethylbilane synthase [Pirellulaceae bacterium]
MARSTRIRLGTRASKLARWQADWVAARLEELGVAVELVPITTRGDRDQRGPIGTIGTQGVFTKEIQRALLDGRIDLAVHSLKDLPTEPVEGLCLAAVPERDSVRDALVCREPGSLEELRPGAVIGSGSLRRRAQLLHRRADLQIDDIRGNVDTRLKRLADGAFDAIVLAEAGLKRLGLASRITQILPPEIMLSAVGQGALGLETRAEDLATRSALEPLDHPASHTAVLAERTMLAALCGGCLAPIAGWGRVEGAKLVLTGRVVGGDGKCRIEATESDRLTDAARLGRRVADQLLDQGAGDLIAAARGAWG